MPEIGLDKSLARLAKAGVFPDFRRPAWFLWLSLVVVPAARSIGSRHYLIR